MSWNFSVTGITKDEAKAALMADKNVAEWKYCPVAVAEGICKALDGLPEPQDGSKLRISTHGHINNDGSGGRKGGDTVGLALSFEPREYETDDVKALEIVVRAANREAAGKGERG